MYAYCSNNPVRYIDPTGRESGTSEEVTGAKIGEHICPEINIVITQSNEKNDSHNATKGSLSVYWKTDKDTSENGKLVLTVPTVSGGDGNESTKKGYYPNLPQESTNTSSNEILHDDKHGGNNNIMIRLPGTDGQAIHQGNNTVTQDGALTEGCIAVTATDLNFNNGKSDVDRNYEAFKNALCPYGYQGVRVNVTVK